MLQVMQATRYDPKADVIAINEPWSRTQLSILASLMFPGVTTDDLVRMKLDMVERAIFHRRAVPRLKRSIE
jgi:hypothetical protein